MMSNFKFEIGEEVIIATDEASLRKISITDYLVIGKVGEICDQEFDTTLNMNFYGIKSDDPTLNGYWFSEDMIKLTSDIQPISISEIDFETLFH